MDVEGSSSDRRGSRQRKDEGNSSRKQQHRPQHQNFGRPARSTDVHNVHKDGARSTARSTD